MNDNSIMSFGPYKGLTLEKVPAPYLISLLMVSDLDKDLRFYIEDNMDVLQLEIKRNNDDFKYSNDY